MLKQAISLSHLASIINDSLEATFVDLPIWVVAETSDIKNYTDRFYCFLSLIEKNENKIAAKLEAVIWRNNYHIIKNFESITQIKFDKNLKLLLLVTVTFNAQYGLKLNVIDIDSSYTLGNIELERKAILQRLASENPTFIAFDGQDYITVNKQLQFAPLINNVALITAPNSDGQRDFIHELVNNSFNYKFKIDEFLTQIQGNGASDSIISQLQLIAASKKKYDVVVIARGGGAQTDFSAFENYYLAIAIASFPVPIITGIGHERNISIADMMSHLALKTPTKVASYIIDYNANFENNLKVNYTYILQHYNQLIAAHKLHIDEVKKTIIDASKNIVSNQKHQLEKMTLTLKLLSPESVLARGYAIVSRNSKIEVNGKSLKQNDEINIRFLNENIDAIITKSNG